MKKKEKEKDHKQAEKDLEKEIQRANDLRWTTGWITFGKQKY